MILFKHKITHDPVDSSVGFSHGLPDNSLVSSMIGRESFENFQKSVIKKYGDSLGDRVQGYMRQVAQEQPVDTPTRQSVQDVAKVINLPKFEPVEGSSQDSFAALQEWEGVVTAIKNEMIFASLIDITANATLEEEIAEIPIAEVSEKDRERLAPGAIFRWLIGFYKKPSGTKYRGSLIYFRRAQGNPQRFETPPPLVFEGEDDANAGAGARSY